MKIEADAIRASLANTTTETVSGVEFTRGNLHGKDVVIAVCGIGKVFAAICTEAMILKYAPALIINSGVAGTLTDALSIGDIAIAKTLVQHDMDTSPLGDPVGLISGINIITVPADEKLSALLAECVRDMGSKCVVGTIASGDQFVAAKEKKDEIRSKFDVIAAEMEGGAIGQVCYINNIPFAILRTISDGEGGGMDYAQFVVKAAEVSIAVVQKFIARVGEL